MKLHKDQKVLCVCRNGQVRSVAVRYILAEWFGFRKVITCGWAMNDEETLTTLSEWADAIIVVGQANKWKLNLPTHKTHLIDVGPDIYGHYLHHELLRLIVPKVEELVAS